MKWFRCFFIVFLPLTTLFMSCTNNHKTIGHLNSNLYYQGRIDKSNKNFAQFFWPGSSVKIKFTGEKIRATLSDDTGNTWYNIIIDNDSIYQIKPEKEPKEFLLAHLNKGEHTVEIFRRTDFTTGTTHFYGFRLDEGSKILPIKQKKKHIEFYGNSITTGYANENYTGGDESDSIYTNNYNSYAAITARHFDAGYSCISLSGIGFMVSWFPAIMPGLYDRLNPNNAESKWNFASIQPDVVVVNLGQNDSWILKMPNSDEYKYRFANKKISDVDIVDHYKQFILQLRSKYPESEILCVLGCMDATNIGSQWPEYIKSAVTQLNDKAIHYHFFPCTAIDGHPRVMEHKKMAESLINILTQTHVILQKDEDDIRTVQ